MQKVVVGHFSKVCSMRALYTLPRNDMGVGIASAGAAGGATMLQIDKIDN